MDYTICKEGETWRITKLHVSTQEEFRLVSIGVYEGAHLKMIRKGKNKGPSLFYINGRLWMIRFKDLMRMEGECI